MICERHETRLSLGMEYNDTLATWVYLRPPQNISDVTFWDTRPNSPSNDTGPYITFTPDQFWTPFSSSDARGHVCKTRAAGNNTVGTFVMKHGISSFTV